MNAQIIEKNGKPEWAVIPYNEFKKIKKSLEDAEDIKDIEEHLKDIQDGKEPLIPAEITFSILEGEHPIRAWRKRKDLKVNELTRMIGISSAYLSQIENNKRNPTINTLKLIADALSIEIEFLIA